MTTNRKFENAAIFRSRIALLVALAVHFTLIGYLLLKDENSGGVFSKIKSLTTEVVEKPKA
ncbi:MAG: hypothetical protein GC192_21715 [Bacteroidetes bacterium]|nr:hypothetical protein [Bacteroidota bacterium]